MADDGFDPGREPRGKSVPSGRLSRLGGLARMAGGIAGGMVAEGARHLADGRRPRAADLLLTPGNVARVADQLANMRGAAMKLGQMISMDAGDFLPAELSAILGRLRDRAHHMPPAQLNAVLAREYGRDWRRRFAYFCAEPLAAASIGQVHRATTHDGRHLAIKVQYPGVRESIDADIDNVATLLRVSGLLPPGLDLAPLLAEAKRQLHEEADYAREGAVMMRYAALLGNTPAFVVPTPDAEFSTDRVLAMSFEEGVGVETLVDAPQDVRDRVARTLIALVLRELFSFGLMQTDPNFANYRYRPDTGQLVLLDFGAARDVGAETAAGYRRVLGAAMNGHRDGLRDAAVAAGFLGQAAVDGHRDAIDRIIEIVLVEFRRPGAFDFGDRGFVGTLRDEATGIAQDRATWHVPPADTLFVQRKVSGTALLAARLKARVDVRALIADALKPGDPAE